MQKPTTAKEMYSATIGTQYTMSSFKVRNHQERVAEALVEPEVGEDQGETFFYTS